MNALLLAAALAGAAAAGTLPLVEPAKDDTLVVKAIFKGEPPSAAELRSLVSIEFRDRDGKRPFTCSGVLISSNVAATTGHCWDEGFTPRTVSLHGARDAVRRVIHGQRHDDYDETADPDHAVDDVGFVVFGGKTPDGAGPAPLLDDPSGVKAGDAVVLVGTGHVEEGAVRGPRRAALRVVRVDAATFSASAGGATGSCLGDSGGPAFILKDGRLVTAGLISSGPATNCHSAGASELTFIPPYRAWLLTVSKAAQDRLSANR